MYFNYYTGGAIYTSSPAVADGVVYFGSSGRDHTVYALNAKTGALLAIHYWQACGVFACGRQWCGVCQFVR